MILKSELKSGMVVRTENGQLYMVLLNVSDETTDFWDTDILIGINMSGKISSGMWMPLSKYDEDLQCQDNLDFSVKEVYSVRFAADLGKIREYKQIERK